jgi:hypothetical protein
MEKNVVGGTCGTYGGEERLIQYSVLAENPEGKNHCKDPGEDGRIILRWIFRKWGGVHGHDRSDSG